LDNNVAPFAESMFVRMANSEIQRLISVRTVGNQALNFAIFHLFSLFSILTDGKYQHLAVNFRPYGRKI